MSYNEKIELLESRIAELDKNRDLAVESLNESMNAYSNIIKQVESKKLTDESMKDVVPFFERAIKKSLEFFRVNSDIIREFAPSVSDDIEKICEEIETTTILTVNIRKNLRGNLEQMNEAIKLMNKIKEGNQQVAKIINTARDSIKGTLNKIKN